VDAQVESGDVVVGKTAAAAIPYFMYQIFNRFGTGLGFGIPRFWNPDPVKVGAPWRI
jgi:hypothetical protein